MKAKLGKLRMIRCAECEGHGIVQAPTNQIICDVEDCKVCKGTGKIKEGRI